MLHAISFLLAANLWLLVYQNVSVGFRAFEPRSLIKTAAMLESVHQDRIVREAFIAFLCM
jgi:hypothetical protein